MYYLKKITWRCVKAIFLPAIILIMQAAAFAQPISSYHEYHILDSISKTNSRASYFASLFINTLDEIENELQQKDSAARVFTRKFELAFIHYFTDECARFENGDSVGAVWQAYFYGAEKKLLEYQLAGANAHINGDIWKALVNNFSKEEIEANAGCFISYQKSLDRVFNKYYDEARQKSFKLRLLHTISLGMAKPSGRGMMHKWRKRQEQLAVLYFTDKKKFEKKLNRINKKRSRIDKKILLLF